MEASSGSSRQGWSRDPTRKGRKARRTLQQTRVLARKAAGVEHQHGPWSIRGHFKQKWKVRKARLSAP